MTLEATKERLAALAAFEGEIGLEGDMGTEEIVVRFPFYGCKEAAEEAYNELVDMESERCAECGKPTPRQCWGLCLKCAREAFTPDELKGGIKQ